MDFVYLLHSIITDFKLFIFIYFLTKLEFIPIIIKANFIIKVIKDIIAYFLIKSMVIKVNILVMVIAITITYFVAEYFVIKAKILVKNIAHFIPYLEATYFAIKPNILIKDIVLGNFE